jgi:hypothetical protein
MDTVRALSVWSYGTPNAVKSRAARVEKCPDCGGLQGESPDNPEPRDRRASTSDRRVLSRTGTAQTAPLWYGPRLRAPFVAQFIGQILSNEETACVSRPVYGPEERAIAQVIDRSA